MTVTGTDRPSVALLTNAPAPYRTSLFNELSKRCRLLVSFETRREPDREWTINEREFEFHSVFTRTLTLPRTRVRSEFSERRVVHVPLNLFSVLNHFQPDVVVSSELGARTVTAAAFCRLRKRALIAWWEGTPRSEDGTGALTTALRRMELRSATRAWANGEESAKSLAALGVPESRIDLGMTGMDTPRWRKEVDEERGATRSSVREQHGLKGSVVLFAGSLTARKGIQELLAALSLLAADCELPAWSVLFVGSGPLAEEVQRWALLHPAVPVALTGFVQPQELAKYFAAADVFVMPSLEDVWGLVCLEALVAGIPQVTSLLAGAAVDVVTSSEIGCIVDPRDPRSLAHQLAQRIHAGPQRIPEAIRDRATDHWSPAAVAEHAMSSVRAAIRDRSQPR